MTTALAERPAETALSKDELDLIRKTVANGATDTELKLFLYDCQRRGIHPLDKLLHFTKRGGKYTPVTSIDFMRSQAAASGEMAGSDDPVFQNDPDGQLRIISASVTVYRLTQGQRFPYTATARWEEYYPGDGLQGAMWRKMPRTMLGKCAEALALRKAFPQQLAGLYSSEEMDQAGGPKGYTVEAPAASPTALASPEGAARRDVSRPVRAELPADADLSAGASSDNGPDLQVDADPDGLYISRMDVRDTRNPNVKKHLIVLSDGREVSTINTQLAGLAEQCCQDRAPVAVTTKTTKWGDELVTLTRGERVIQIDHSDPVDPKDLPF